MLQLVRLSFSEKVALSALGWISAFCSLAPIIFMLQVFDRILVSHNEVSLLILVIVLAVVYFFMWITDLARANYLSVLSISFEQSVVKKYSMNTDSVRQIRDTGVANFTNDLNTIRRYFESGFVLGVLDLPVIVFFGWILYSLNILFFYLFGAALLAMFAVMVMVVLSGRRESAQRLAWSVASDGLTQFGRQFSSSSSIGMVQPVIRGVFLSAVGFADGALKALGLSLASKQAQKFIRLTSTSGALGLGVYLIFRDQLSVGGAVAASMIFSKGLSPLDQVLGGFGLWRESRKAIYR